jgi:hypothetical protein
MRFDLEIPVLDSFSLTYVEEGSDIPGDFVPLYYFAVDSKDKFPEDFIGVDPAVTPERSITDKFRKFLLLESKSIGTDKILVTNQFKYVASKADYIPYFYKFELGEMVKENEIRIIDIIGSTITKDNYLVSENYAAPYTIVYLNKPEAPLFIEYTRGNKIIKRLVNFTPVATEMTIEEVAGRSYSGFKYFVDLSGVIQLRNYIGDIYVSTLSDTKLYRMPKCNIEDPWYISILNTTFKETINSHTYSYSIPEYYNQEFAGKGYFKYKENKKCKILSQDTVQSQFNILTDGTEAQQLEVIVKDYYTGQVKYAFTNLALKAGIQYKDTVYYIQLLDFNTDGVIYLPIKLSDRDVVYASHYIKEDYYEFKLLDLSKASLTAGGYFAIYIKPDVQDGERSVYYAKIGMDEAIGQNSLTAPNSFSNLASYQATCAASGFKSVVIIAISANAESQIVKTVDIRQIGGVLRDKEIACKSSVGILAEDILTGAIKIPTNDSVIAVLNADMPVRNKQIAFDGTYSPDEYTKTVLDNINNVIENNLEVSTKHILQIDYDTHKIYEVVAICGDGGTISPYGKLMVKDNESVNFSITPAQGFSIAEVYIDGTKELFANSSYTFSNLSNDKTIDVRFK